MTIKNYFKTILFNFFLFDFNISCNPYFFGIKEGKALHLNLKNNEIPDPSFLLDP
jgi:hypothetical protein